MAGRTQTLSEFAQEFGFLPGGLNEYYGLVRANADRFKTNGGALDPSPHKHDAHFDMVLDSLRTGEATEMTVMLGLEPKQTADAAAGIRAAYDFVRDNLPLVDALAQALDEKQRAAQELGKTLRIVVRYASEMNSGGTPYGRPTLGDPTRQVHDFKETFRALRARFKQHAPNVLWAFSPALRADVDTDVIATYWPGDEFVDVVSGTWYVHGDAQAKSSLACLTGYVRDFGNRGIPFALDEVGGANGANDEYRDHAERLAAMLPLVQSLGVPLEHLTLFLQEPKWGRRDAMHLPFLQAASTGSLAGAALGAAASAAAPAPNTIAVGVFLPQGAGGGAAALARVSRRVSATTPARDSLNALLAGPTPDERAAGIMALDTKGLSLSDITLAGGVARSDFAAASDRRFRDAASTRQFAEAVLQTLRQFSTIQQVVSSVNGDTRFASPV